MENTEQPSENRRPLNDQWAIDDVISSLRRLLIFNCDNKEDFDRAFSKLINNSNRLEGWQVARLNESSSTGFNFLMLASKYGNIDAVIFLISCGLNVNKKDGQSLTASDYAWQKKSCKCLIELLKADAPFPKDFNIEELESSYDKLEIIEICEKTVKFHKSIESGNLDEIKLFACEHPKVRFAYNENNQSALTTALINKKTKVYSFLRNKFFEAGVDSDSYSDQLKKLPISIKKQLSKQLKKHLDKPVENHIMILLSKSRARSGSTEIFKKIVDFYVALDEIPEIRPILHMVANSEITDIVFDFNQKGVYDLDHLEDDNTLGLTYHAGTKAGYILIGAGRNEAEVLATIAHEFTHWAMQLTYSNNCQPYCTNNAHRRQIYEEFIEKYKSDEDLHRKYSEIAEIYNPETYKPNEISKELIVRVPQLLACNRNSQSKLIEFREALKGLFDFFIYNVLPDVEQALWMVCQKKAIKNANKEFGIFKKYLKSNVLSLSSKKSINVCKSLFIKTSSPTIALEMILRAMQQAESKEIDSNNIFIELDQMFEGGNAETLIEAANSEIKPSLFIIDKNNNFRDGKVENFLNSLHSIKIILISSSDWSSFQKFFEEEIKIDFEWNDLNEQSKLKFMASKVTFQDLEVTMNEIITNDSLLLQQLPLEMILSPTMIKLSSFKEKLPPEPRVIIKRKFQGTNFKLYSSNDLCDMLQNHRTIIIADEAGMGKSTSAAKLARDLKLENPTFWVVFIDLKQYTRVFIKNGQPKPENIAADFFSQSFLKLSSSFEQKLFANRYDNKKVIFIFDGFDEISPNYNEFVMEIVKTVKDSENCLVITTRPNYAKELENQLKVGSIKLMPFDDENCIDFLTKYWKIDESGGNYLETKIVELLAKLKKFLRSNNFFSVPINIFMLAEVYNFQELIKAEDGKDFKINIYYLYKNFLSMKLKIWYNKGKLAEDDSLTLQQTVPAINFVHIFHKIAIEQFFNDDEIASLSLLEIPEEVINDMIFRVGIVAYSLEGIPQFLHRTFAEYFAADFIFSRAMRKDAKKPILKLFITFLINERFEQVRKFLNDRLQNVKEVLQTEALARYVEEVAMEDAEIRDEYDHKNCNMLIIITKEEQTDLITFLLKTLDFDYKLKLELVKNVIFEEHSFMKPFDTIWNCVKDYVDVDGHNSFQRDLLFLKNNHQVSILEAAIWREIEFTQFLLNKAKFFLNDEDFLSFLCADASTKPFLSTAFQYSIVRFSLLWEEVKEKLGFENQKKWLTWKDREGNTCLHCSPKSVDDLLICLEIMNNLLNEVEFNELLTATDHKGRNFLFYVIASIKLEEFEVIWQFLEENASEATKEKLILSEDIDKEILLEASARPMYNNLVDFIGPSKIDCIFSLTESLLKKKRKNITNFLRERGSLVQVVLRSAGYRKLFEKFSERLDKTELRNILLSKTLVHGNTLHLMALKHEDEEGAIWKTIVEVIQDPKELKRLLFEKRSWDFANVFHVTAGISKSHIFFDILQWCKTNLDKEDNKKIFSEQNCDNSTVLHNVAKNGDRSSIIKCLKFVSENFFKSDCQKFLLIKNIENRIPLQEVCMTWSEDRFQLITEFLKVYSKTFGDQVLDSIILREGFLGTRDEYYDIEKILLFRALALTGGQGPDPFA